MFKITMPLVTLVSSATVLLAGCGGGGSSAPVASNPAPQLASSFSVISQDFAKPTAANAFNAAQTIDTTAAATASFVTGVSLSSAAPSVSKAAIDLFTFFAGNRPASRVTGATQSEQCPDGGSISASGTIQNQDRVSAGDNVSISA